MKSPRLTKEFLLDWKHRHAIAHYASERPATRHQIWFRTDLCRTPHHCINNAATIALSYERGFIISHYKLFSRFTKKLQLRFTVVDVDASILSELIEL